VEPDQQRIVDWVNLPEGVATLSLWETLHDGDLLAVESDLLARTVTLKFDVMYVRDFHKLSEQTRFAAAMSGVQSVRSVRSVPWPGGFLLPQRASREEESTLIAECQSKCREESQSWSEFESLIGDGLEVSNAILASGSNGVALELGLLAGDGHYVEARIRGEAIAFFVGEQAVTPEEFVGLGQAYWDAFAKRKSEFAFRTPIPKRYIEVPIRFVERCPTSQSMVFKNISRPTSKEKSFQCPCCGFKTLYGRGQEEICPVCFWEDDGQDSHDADEVRGGPNGHLSLTQARLNFRDFGVSDARFAANVRAPLEDERA
jgi:Cysteine-rich CPCC